MFTTVSTRSATFRLSVKQPDLKFQQAALAYIVHHVLDIKEVREIRKIFEAFDLNHDGKLSHNEILTGFKKKCGVTLNEKDFLKTIKRIDQDKSGYIDYEDFIRAAMNKNDLLSEQKLSIAFRLFDLDGGGEISSGELKQILGLNARFSNAVWNEIINQFENNNNDEINYDEFKSLMQKLKT